MQQLNRITFIFLFVITTINFSFAQSGATLTETEMKDLHVSKTMNKYSLVYKTVGYDDLYGVIETSSRKVIVPIFWKENAIQYSEGDFIIRMKDDMFKYVGGTGTLIGFYEKSIPYQHGYSIVKSKSMGWGLINLSGKQVIPYNKDYGSMWDYSEGTVLISPQSGDADIFIMDTTGKVVLKNTTTLRLGGDGLYSVHEGLIIMTDYTTYKSGFADKTGKIVIPLKFENVSFFQEGLAPASSGGKWGFINKTGKFIIQPQYTSVNNFKDGYAQVIDLQNKTIIIDKAGKVKKGV